MIWFIIKIDRPTKFGDFAHGYYYSRRPYTKLTCPSPTTGARGLPPRFHTNRRRGTVHQGERLVRSPKPGKSTSCASFPHPHRCNRKERRSLQSASTDDNGTPATWTLGLVFQQAIDRQDRTLQSPRTLQLYWNYTGDIITAWYTGILHRTRTRRNSRRHAL